MGQALTTTNISAIRPEWTVYFTYTLDFSEEQEHFAETFRPASDPTDMSDIRNAFLSKPSIEHGYYKWSPEQGYVSYHSEQLVGEHEHVFTIGDTYHDIKLLFSDAILMRLTKLTGYDYFSAGHYELFHVRIDEQTALIPKHWLNGIEYDPDHGLKFSDGKLYQTKPSLNVFKKGDTIYDVVYMSHPDIYETHFNVTRYKIAINNNTDISFVCR